MLVVALLLLVTVTLIVLPNIAMLLAILWVSSILLLLIVPIALLLSVLGVAAVLLVLLPWLKGLGARLERGCSWREAMSLALLPVYVEVLLGLARQVIILRCRIVFPRVET